MKDENKEQYYTTKKAAELIGCSRSYLNVLCREGKIAYTKVPGQGKAGWVNLVPESTVEQLKITVNNVPNLITDISFSPNKDGSLVGSDGVIYYPVNTATELIGCDKTYLTYLCHSNQIEHKKIKGDGGYRFKYIIPEFVIEKLMSFREDGRTLMGLVNSISATKEKEDITIPENNVVDPIPEETVQSWQMPDILAALNTLQNIAPELEELVNVLNTRFSTIFENTDWQESAKEKLESYQQGFVEGYRAGFKDGRNA